ncbi:NAD(P)-binding domain-containing protein [Vagococcus fluvialis]|uniref:saccharopine dehydrogenase NADP-binding domain-containing protein n=1 Tax=Vagococcus fluvialis TaxID=2738 RepID=UPI001432ACF9|nr:saccharopine dehydrogenase NADP-binding domain-containing protein [Vagococcus fluvialis]NKC59117.1 NAD(P)-binding domain-containing protein [Vagococcus fluvialis]NKD49873.1 NAD(P)-binding domain-containing protein [Vagococcus fluvialis]
MKNKLLIIGGHGAVGSIILKYLIRRGIPESKIVIAGRNKEKMATFIKKDKLAIDYLTLDIHQPVDKEVLKDIRMILMCIDQVDTKFVSESINLKIDYVDITANSDFIKAVNQLPKTKDVSVITSVGLAPGLTNLATSYYINKYQPKEITIDILLGTGESHGEAAVHWMFDHINQPYKIKQMSEPIKNFTLKRKVDFTPKLKNKVTYNFNFSDQHILQDSYLEILITTYLGFDVNFVSNSLHFLNKRSRLGWLESEKSISTLKKLMSRKIIGNDDFAIHISNGQSDKKGISIYGNNEKEITGKVASFVVYRVFTNSEKIGIESIEGVCSLEEIVTEMEVKSIGL